MISHLILRLAQILHDFLKALTSGAAVAVGVAAEEEVLAWVLLMSASHTAMKNCFQAESDLRGSKAGEGVIGTDFRGIEHVHVRDSLCLSSGGGGAIFVSIHPTSNCLRAKKHSRRTVCSAGLFKADLKGIGSTHLMLNCKCSLKSSGASGAAVSVSVQSAIVYDKSATKNLLFLKDVNDPFNADKGVVVELSQERQVFVEEGHAERTLVANELNLLAGELKLLGGELFVRHLA